MFRVQIAEQEFAMDAPQGQNQFFERCAEMLLELSDELERNLYIEAIVKEYGRYGVGTEDIRKRVNTLALKGTPAEKRIQPKSGTPETKKKESAADKAQKLMLTWLVTYPGSLNRWRNIFHRQILWCRCIKRWPRCCLTSIKKERRIRETSQCIYR